MAGSAVALGTLLALRAARGALLSRLLARDHREQDRPARLPAAGDRPGAAMASRSRSSTPTPRAAWCSPTRWRSRRGASRALMLDFATLTGACVNALTERYSGAFTNRPALRRRCRRPAAQRRARLVLPDGRGLRHRPRQHGGRRAAVRDRGQGRPHPRGAFPARFVPERLPWAHVDLSSATRSGGLAPRRRPTSRASACASRSQLLLRRPVLRA